MIKFSYCLWQIIYSDNADISEDLGLPQSVRKWSFSWCWGTSPMSFIAGHRILLRRALPQRWDNTRSSSPVTGFSGWATLFCGRDNLFVSCTKCIFVYWCFYYYLFQISPSGAASSRSSSTILWWRSCLSLDYQACAGACGRSVKITFERSTGILRSCWPTPAP